MKPTKLLANYSYRLLVLLALIIFYAVYLRVGSLNQWLLNLDDIGHIRLSSGNLNDIIKQTYTDPHPILRNLVLSVLLKNGVSDQLYRLVGLVPGLMLIPLFYLIVKKTFQCRQLAFYSFVLISFSYVFVNLSQTTRPYCLAILFITAAQYFSLKYKENYQVRNLYLVCFFCILSILTEYGSIFFISFIFLYNIFHSKEHKHFIIWIWTFAISSLIYVAQFSSFFLNSHHRSYNMKSLDNKFPESLLDIPLAVYNISYQFFSLNRQFGIIFFLLTVLGFFQMYRNKQWEFFYGAIYLFSLAILSGLLKLYPFYAGRHLWFLLPSLVLMQVSGLSFFSKKPWPFRMIAILFILSVIIFNHPIKKLRDINLVNSNYYIKHSPYEFSTSRKNLVRTLGFISSKTENTNSIILTYPFNKTIKFFLTQSYDREIVSLVKNLEVRFQQGNRHFYKDLHDCEMDRHYSESRCLRLRQSLSNRNSIVVLPIKTYNYQNPTIKIFKNSSFAKRIFSNEEWAIFALSLGDK